MSGSRSPSYGSSRITDESSGSSCTDEMNFESVGEVLPPSMLLQEFPLGEKGALHVCRTRQVLRDIYEGRDNRLIAVVGPCSIHDDAAARDYASKLLQVSREVQDAVVVIMRVYFEKPRAGMSAGWKGLITDPLLDNSNQINLGLRKARALMCDIANTGLPIGCEFLDTITAQFVADTVAWGAIGARTTQSQIHREMASAMSMPMGFKHGTDGNMQLAVDAMRSASRPHVFPGFTKDGSACIVKSKGNSHCHIILRGSDAAPNYGPEDVLRVVNMQRQNGFKRTRVMIDVSHGNSGHDHRKQPLVLAEVCNQVRSGSKNILGVMVESNLFPGNQPFVPGSTPVNSLKYGVSITDACVGFPETADMLRQLADAVRNSS